MPQSDSRPGGTWRSSSASDERRRAADEVAARLRNVGVTLTERESDEELVRILDAVERFESAVRRRGGDLMVDEPVAGRGQPLAPENRDFVLPVRRDDETVAAFIERVDRATAGASSAR